MHESLEWDYASRLAIGGYPNQSSLHLYFPLTQSWLPTGEMPLGVCKTCTVTLPIGEMMVIGGETSDTWYSLSSKLWQAYMYMWSGNY